ncbi:hypothetical protein Mapa_016389 [Marchantia paleacea]|nr:hypothetical protein Mapa_016389 [Marchantia paleacea]
MHTDVKPQNYITCLAQFIFDVLHGFGFNILDARLVTVSFFKIKVPLEKGL